MSRICDLTGKKAVSGNNVSFSHKKTKRKFDINLHKKRFFLPDQEKWVEFRVSASGLRTINKLGIEQAIKKFSEKGTVSRRLAKQMK